MSDCKSLHPFQFWSLFAHSFNLLNESKVYFVVPKDERFGMLRRRLTIQVAILLFEMSKAVEIGEVVNGRQI